VLRAANRIAGDPLDPVALRELAAELGSDVPSQVEPHHALVSGVGEQVEPLGLPELAVLLVPQRTGLSTAAVYAEFDRIGGGRRNLDLDALRSLARDMHLLPVLANDLQPAALALRPELADVLASLRGARALGALVSGSGPTCFAVFEDSAAAEAAAGRFDGAIVTRLRRC
jgi:4-diphosphocytidyl-2-C-methyl-D-erythritol kinase